MSICDGCGKERRDIQSCGRDYNGDPDAPDLCFICRKEAEKNRIFHKNMNKYIYYSHYMNDI